MKKMLILLSVLVIFAYLVPLGVRELFSPDETRYGEIGREMLVRNDWVVPHLNGVHYFEKPVMGYWLFAASQKVFGLNAFSVRFPCMFATLLSALALFFLSKRFSAGGTKEGLLASFVFLLTPLVFGLGIASTLDPLLSCFLTAGMVLFYFAVHSHGWKKTGLLFACGLSFGAAFLTKGFLAFVLPGISIFAYLIWTRRFKELFLLPWIPLLGVLLITLPWAWEIHRAAPDFWPYFIYDEHIKRFLEKEQHPEPFYFFIPVLLGGLGYLLFYIPTAVQGFKKTVFKDDFFRFNFCWFLLPFLFFSASSGKLATYILPCFAPLAVLFSAGFYKAFIEEKKFSVFNIVTQVFGGAALLAAIVLAIIQLSNPEWAPFNKMESWKWVSILLAGAILAVFLYFSSTEKKAWDKLAYLCIALIPVLFLIHFVVPELITARKSACALLERIKPKIGPEVKIMSYRYPFQDVCWVFKKDDVSMYRFGGELTRGLEFMKQEHRVLNIEETNDFILENRKKGGVLLILPNKIYSEDKGKLPKPRWIESNSKDRKGYSAVLF